MVVTHRDNVPLETLKDEAYGSIASLNGGATSSVQAGHEEHDSAHASPAPYTIQEAIDHMGFGWFQIKISVILGICWMAESFEMMLLSILGPLVNCEWGLSQWEQALLTTLVMLGMMLSSSPVGSMCDQYGRKTVIVLCTSLGGYFGLLTAVSPSFKWVCTLRFLVGCALGISPQTITLYSEFLPTKSRSVCVIALEVFFALGACINALMAKLVIPTLGWRYHVAFTAVPFSVIPLLSIWLPESARFYLASGHPDKAKAILVKMASDNNRKLPPGDLIGSEDQERGRVKDLFAGELKLASILLFTCWLLVAFCYFGMSLLVPTLLTQPDGCHGSDIHKTVEQNCQSECKAFSQQDYSDLALTSFSELPGLLFIVGLMTYTGRKMSIALCGALFSVSLAAANFCMTRTPLTVLLFIARGLISGVFQGVYVYTTEVYPTVVRSLGMGASSMMARLGALLTPYLAQVATKESAYIGINGYVAAGLLVVVLVLCWPIETKGRGMKETTGE